MKAVTPPPVLKDHPHKGVIILFYITPLSGVRGSHVEFQSLPQTETAVFCLWVLCFISFNAIYKQKTKTHSTDVHPSYTSVSAMTAIGLPQEREAIIADLSP